MFDVGVDITVELGAIEEWMAVVDNDTFLDKIQVGLVFSSSDGSGDLMWFNGVLDGEFAVFNERFGVLAMANDRINYRLVIMTDGFESYTIVC
jgi:hypothetical protein